MPLHKLVEIPSLIKDKLLEYDENNAALIVNCELC